MSFDIWTSSFKAGESYYFSRSLLDEIFRPYLIHRDGGDLYVKFPDGGEAEISSYSEPEIGGIAVNRPPDSPEFWEGLMELLRRTPSSLYWPGSGISAVVANPEVIKELPASFIEAVGIPKVVSTGAEIYKCVWSR